MQQNLAIKLIHTYWVGGAKGKVRSTVSNPAVKWRKRETNHKKIIKSSLQRCSPRSCPECSHTLCIICCHVRMICISSAGFETLLELFAIGIKPKYSNVMVRLPGENKGGNIVWGFEHRTWGWFRVQSCILATQGAFWAQSLTWLCSCSLLCHCDLRAWCCGGTQLVVFRGMPTVWGGRWSRTITFCILRVQMSLNFATKMDPWTGVWWCLQVPPT